MDAESKILEVESNLMKMEQAKNLLIFMEGELCDKEINTQSIVSIIHDLTYRFDKIKTCLCIATDLLHDNIQEMNKVLYETEQTIKN